MVGKFKTTYNFSLGIKANAVLTITLDGELNKNE